MYSPATTVSTVELLRPPIRTVALTISFAACLRGTGPNGSVGSGQTDTWSSRGKTKGQVSTILSVVLTSDAFHFLKQQNMLKVSKK